MDTTGLWQGQAWAELLKHSTLLDVTAPSRWQKMKESFRWPGPRHSFIKAREKTRAQWQESACQGHPAHEEQVWAQAQAPNPNTSSFPGAKQWGKLWQWMREFCFQDNRYPYKGGKASAKGPVCCSRWLAIFISSLSDSNCFAKWPKCVALALCPCSSST